VDHYQTLGITSTATQAEIKQAYRQLAKAFHPDRHRHSQPEVIDRAAQQILSINAAYEVLGDVQQRQTYDRYRLWTGEGVERPAVDRQPDSATVQTHQRQRRQTVQSQDQQLAVWIKQVYTPVHRLLGQTLKEFRPALTALSADPFDDDLMAEFQGYLDRSGDRQTKAQALFQAHGNPPQIARLAMNLYYCLHQVGDGLAELERFTLCYDDSYLKDGKEMFRIATRMRREVQSDFRDLNCR